MTFAEISWCIGCVLFVVGSLIHTYAKRNAQQFEIRSLKADVAELTAIRDGLVARVEALEAKASAQGKRVDVTVAQEVVQYEVQGHWSEWDRMVAEKRREAFERLRDERDALRDELLEGKPL